MRKGLLMNEQLTTHATVCTVLPSSGIKDNSEATLSSTKIRRKIQTVPKKVAKKRFLLFTCNVLYCGTLKKNKKIKKSPL